jgi:hypothetical protein
LAATGNNDHPQIDYPREMNTILPSLFHFRKDLTTAERLCFAICQEYEIASPLRGKKGGGFLPDSLGEYLKTSFKYYWSLFTKYKK